MNLQTNLPTRGEELTQAAIKGVVSAIPVVGGLISELGVCLASPLEKRKQAWSKEVETALEELSSKYERLPEDLSSDSAFVTALLKATGIALATHQQTKIDVLRRFLVSVGSLSIPDEELQHALLRLLEDLSVGHLEVLRFIDNNYETVSSFDNMDDIFDQYRLDNSGQLDRMAFRWMLSDLSSRMVIHLGDIKDLSEFASQMGLILRPESKVRPLQITDLGRQMLRMLKRDHRPLLED